MIHAAVFTAPVANIKLSAAARAASKLTENPLTVDVPLLPAAVEKVIAIAGSAGAGQRKRNKNKQ